MWALLLALILLIGVTVTSFSALLIFATSADFINLSNPAWTGDLGYFVNVIRNGNVSKNVRRTPGY